MSEHRHKREPLAPRWSTLRRSRVTLVAVPVALIATVCAVGYGVASADPQRLGAAAGSASLSEALQERDPLVTRSANRRSANLRAQDVRTVRKIQARAARLQAEARAKAQAKAEAEATARAVREAHTRLWTTENLNLWSGSEEKARNLGLVESGEKVLVTGRKADEREEIVVGGEARWVTAGYLSDEEPVAGIGGACTNGSSVPSGVSPNITQVHAAVCAAFPEITAYGTFRSDGEHAQGIAIDIMVSGSRGWEVAEFVRANSAALGVNYAIYSQSIWSVDRSGEGWRGMSDRGSTTANHYDHVHVTTY